MKVALLLALIAAVSGKIFFQENFDANWESRWVQSTWKPEEQRGKLVRTAGVHGDDSYHGVQTSQDARFYTYAAKIDPPFSSKGKDIVIQYTVKHEQNLDCGGNYLKFLKSGDDLESFNGDTAYNVMFGPDWCGSGHRRIHAIVEKDGTNYLNERLEAVAPSDQLTHRLAMRLFANNSYAIIVDDKVVQRGNYFDRPDYTILPEKEIPDPKVSKPSDWVDEAEIDDPEDLKPEGYDDIPATIADPEAKKPDDWDDELDGEWEAPQISNPEYKGAWKPKRIPNPKYVGPWEHPKIPNPDYVVPSGLATYDSWGAVGFEVWQVKSGSIIGGILITDSLEEADAAWAKTEAYRKVEKEEFDKAEAERKAKEAEAAKKAAEEAEKKAKEEEAKKAEEKTDDAAEEKKDEL